MRFKKGDQVEVLNKREDHAQSWWCAEIISCSGHNYYVRYDRDLSCAGSCVERVPRRAIRPCPPSAEGCLDWVPGDIVEVFNNFSWKLAKIVMFYGQECFFVRFLGSSTELLVNSCGIRPRQFWHDNKWVALKKGSAKFSGKTNCFSKEMTNSKAWKHVDDQFKDGKTMYFGNTSQTYSMGAKKRTRVCSRQKCSGAFRSRYAEKGHHQGVYALKSTRLNKVDAVASPQTLFGEKYVHSSPFNKKTGTFETNQLTGLPNDDSRHCSRLMLESSDAESVSSSVGSCSIINNPCSTIFPTFYSMDQDMEPNCNLSEAFVTLGKETSLPANEVLAQDIHSLELHAYRCTMIALYASGAISWEQESLLTNLRLMLHISINEHSLELKNLSSALQMILLDN